MTGIDVWIITVGSFVIGFVVGRWKRNKMKKKRK
jgi:hypothetical protein